MTIGSNPLWCFFPVIGVVAAVVITIAVILYQRLEDELVLWLREVLRLNKGKSYDNAKLYRQPIMTETESKFYDFLRETIGEKFLIETRKPLTEVFKRDGNLSRELWTMHTKGHVDFLIVEPKTKNPILGIELDDWTHERTKRQDADRRKDELFNRGELRLLRFKVRTWGEEERKLIQDILRMTELDYDRVR